jgi:hypothetical protein
MDILLAGDPVVKGSGWSLSNKDRLFAKNNEIEFNIRSESNNATVDLLKSFSVNEIDFRFAINSNTQECVLYSKSMDEQHSLVTWTKVGTLGVVPIEVLDYLKSGLYNPRYSVKHMRALDVIDKNSLMEYADEMEYLSEEKFKEVMTRIDDFMTNYIYIISIGFHHG